MEKIFLLRHAPSVWNISRRWQGQQNPELSEKGAHQAKAWADAVKKSGLGLTDKDASFASIWSSDLTRAQQTAEVIAKELELELQIDKRLRERSLGAWEGLTRPEIDKAWPGAIQKRQFPEGSENNEQVLARALDFFDEYFNGQNASRNTDSTGLKDSRSQDSRQKHKLPALVVSHGGLITCIEEYLGAEWTRLPNLNGRWLKLIPPEKKLELSKRVSYLR